MSLKCLGVVLLVNLTAAEIPSYLNTCRRRDPEVDQCVVNAVAALRDKLRKGIPELQVPSVDPLRFEFLAVLDSDAIKLYTRDIEIVGLSTFTTQSLHLDFEKQILNITSVFSEVIFTAEYEVKAKIVVPIEGRGQMRIAADSIQTMVIMTYEVIKKDVFEYMHFTSMTTKLGIQNYTTEFRPLEGEDAIALTKLITMAMQGDHQELLEAIQPVIETMISTEILKIGNAIGAYLPFNEFFPDTE